MRKLQNGLTTLRRYFGLDDNPLRRRSDRLQSWLKLAVCGLFVVGLVVAGVVGQASYRRGLATEQRAELSYPVTGRVVSVVTWASDQSGGYVPASARVVWRDAAGRRHTDDVVTSAYRGEQVRLWIDRVGHPYPTRYSHTWTVLDAVASGLATAMIAAAGLLSLYLVVVLLIDRRRHSTWDREWLVVEPGWRRQEL